MGRLIEVAFLIFVVVGTILLVRHLVGPHPSAAGIARRRAGARWVVNDTGTTDDGRAVMKIVLVDDGEVYYGHRQVGEPYDLRDDLAWTELHGQAEAMARDLNERIDQAQDRRR